MKSIEDTLRSLGYDYLYDEPKPKKSPSYCMFCIDAPEIELEIHGGCACCGNGGYYKNENR